MFELAKEKYRLSFAAIESGLGDPPMSRGRRVERGISQDLIAKKGNPCSSLASSNILHGRLGRHINLGLGAGLMSGRFGEHLGIMFGLRSCQVHKWATQKGVQSSR